MPENNARVAKAVREWIERHGLTQSVINARGGPSSSTITKLLSGTGGFRNAIYAQLDRGLDWGTGTAEAIWQGKAEANAPKGFDWRSVDDDELLAEVRRRMGGQKDDGNTEAEKRDYYALAAAGGYGDPEDELPEDALSQRYAGEENQDPGADR